jgi:hypothetical protein
MIYKDNEVILVAKELQIVICILLSTYKTCMSLDAFFPHLFHVFGCIR